MSSIPEFAKLRGLGEYGPGGAFYKGEKKEKDEIKEIKEEIKEKQSKFECEVCGAKFDYKIALAGHMKKHNKEN